jgi:hypothetical protein
VHGRPANEGRGSYPEGMGGEALSLLGVACAVVIFVAAAIIIVFS